MTMKVLFEKETYRILGAQIIGFQGVDKRIDVLATAIRARMKAHQLIDLDLAYAPPYSSAKDPVNMAGYIVENIKNGVVKQWYYEDVRSFPETGARRFSMCARRRNTPGVMWRDLSTFPSMNCVSISMSSKRRSRSMSSARVA